MASKGNANAVTLDDRMKEYEAVSTGRLLMRRIPVYARIDGRAFHTFCRGLEKPFDRTMTDTMKKTTAWLVDKTNALLGYTQSDEISLCWEEPDKVPFETRLFKIESVLAAAATSAFTLHGLATPLKDRIEKMFPHFDCRVCQLPDMSELANMFIFRENDCAKNAVNSVALSRFGHGPTQNMSSDEKLAALVKAGVDFEKDVDEDFRFGSYFRREKYSKMLTAEELEKIPPGRRDFDLFGNMTVIRSRVEQFRPGKPLREFENPAAVFRRV